jgi:hypothetical protein
VNKIEELEQKLEAQLAQLRAQKSEMQIVESISAHFLNRHESPITSDALCTDIIDDETCAHLMIEDVSIGDTHNADIYEPRNIHSYCRRAREKEIFIQDATLIY